MNMDTVAQMTRTELKEMLEAVVEATWSRNCWRFWAIRTGTGASEDGTGKAAASAKGSCCRAVWQTF